MSDARRIFDLSAGPISQNILRSLDYSAIANLSPTSRSAVGFVRRNEKTVVPIRARCYQNMGKKMLGNAEMALDSYRGVSSRKSDMREASIGINAIEKYYSSMDDFAIRSEALNPIGPHTRHLAAFILGTMALYSLAVGIATACNKLPGQHTYLEPWGWWVTGEAVACVVGWALGSVTKVCCLSRQKNKAHFFLDRANHFLGGNPVGYHSMAVEPRIPVATESKRM